jgi:hypothetical protein
LQLSPVHGLYHGLVLNAMTKEARESTSEKDLPPDLNRENLAFVRDLTMRLAASSRELKSVRWQRKANADRD